MKLSEHIQECLMKLGESYEYVHKYLDQHAFLADGSFDPMHRDILHNQEGIETIRQMWGAGAARAARLHIVSDLKLEGLGEDEEIPKDTEAYRKRFCPTVTLRDFKYLSELGFLGIDTMKKKGE
jgi:hypothetical protein